MWVAAFLLVLLPSLVLIIIIIINHFTSICSFIIVCMQILNHICELGSHHQAGGQKADPAWEPSPGFTHHRLKRLSFHRAFHVGRDLPVARLIMGLAVNLQTVTFGVKSLGCQNCTAAQGDFPDLFTSRSIFSESSEYVDALVKKLKDGISSSAQITMHCPE